MPQTLNYLLVGDAGIGKAELIHDYESNWSGGREDRLTHNGLLIPTRDLNYAFHLQSTSGEEAEEARLPLYRDANVVFLCFNIASRDSFESVRDKWVKEITNNTGAPFLVVGMNAEVRSNSSILHRGIVSMQDGRKLARDLGAYSYVECSTFNREGLDLVFERAFEAIVGRSDERKCCIIM